MEVLLLSEGLFFGSTRFKKYRICSTGFTVTILEHDGPIIGADIALKTLTTDDDGLPHTLEHLVFMGSSSYPKGFLDFAANRCLSDGTNAWTDQDHTAYTVSCAGKEGFLSFLPLFLDHILFPLITDEAFVTEVYHVNGDGLDGGVVYCEMQTYENTMDTIADRSFAQSVFGSSSPYACETGGRLHELRTSCNVQKCREYHRQMYRPENMNIVISGKVTIEEVTSAITSVNNKVLSDPARFKPTSTSPLDLISLKSCDANSFSSIEMEVIPFPSPEDDDPGCVLFGFKSHPLHHVKQNLSEDIIIEYLINTSASPLTKNLVHVPEPFCSALSYHRYNFPTTVVQLKFQETDPQKHDQLKEVVHTILSQVQKNNLDLERISSLLRNRRLESKLEIEENDLESLVSCAIVDHIYEAECPDLLSAFSQMESYYQELIDESEEYWTGILDRLVSSLVVCIAAQPSSELLTSLEEEDEERIEERCEELGEEKLSELGEILAKAEVFNNNKVPPELFDAIKKPDVNQFDVYDGSTVSPISTLHSKIRFHNIKSSFYRVYMIIDTDKFSDKEKSLVPLLLEACCNLPVSDNEGISMSGDEVATKCEKLFLNHCVDMGLYKEQVCLSFTLAEENLHEGIVLLQQLMFYQLVDEQKIKEYLQNLKSAVKANKRCGYESIQSLFYQHLYPYSTTAKSSLFCQELFLETVSLEDVCLTLQVMLKELFTSDACLHIMSNPELLGRLDTNMLLSLFKLDVESNEAPHFVSLKSFLRKDLGSLMEVDTVVKVPGEETSYMASIVPIFHSLYSDLDIKMRVFKNWFGNLDGVIGREVRGKGLAYHYFAEASALDANLSIQLQQSTDVSAAFSAVKEIIDSIVTSENPAELVDEKQVEVAKSATFSRLVQKVKSDFSAAVWDLNFIHGITKRKSFKEIATELDKVQCDDIVNLCKTYYYKLLSKGESVRIYTIPQAKDV